MCVVATAARLTTLQNLRDIGGLAAGDAVTRSGVLLRSDAPLPDDDVPALRGAWPPRYVVDLRSSGESATAAHPLAIGATEVFAVPILTRASPRELARTAADETLDTLYAELLADAGPAALTVAELIRRDEGSVLVHCSAGKDRTGVLVAILLAAVGVDHDAIIADYVATDAAAPSVIERLARTLSEPDRSVVLAVADARSHLFRAPASAISVVLEAVDEHPGGAAGWMHDAGLSAPHLAELRGRLLEA